MAEFKEVSVTLEAENPEFVLVWDATHRILKNQFIETADEYGISRFEKNLNILPSEEDTLEIRRARVKARWFNKVPYTLKTFILKLAILCADTDFVISKKYEEYSIEILTNLKTLGEIRELKKTIDDVFPCNMIVTHKNSITVTSSGVHFISNGVINSDFIEITTQGGK